MADLRKQGDMRTIPLGGKKAAGRVALVDDADYDLVMQYKWHVQEPNRGNRARQVYAVAGVYLGGGQKNPRYDTFLMHKLLTGFPQTDHIDRNGLNNQRSNLRPATTGQNNANARKRPGGASSQFKGVDWNKSRGLWRARIMVDGHQTNLGRFASEGAAARAYDAAALAAWDDYACLNFPSDAISA